MHDDVHRYALPEVTHEAQSNHTGDLRRADSAGTTAHESVTDRRQHGCQRRLWTGPVDLLCGQCFLGDSSGSRKFREDRECMPPQFSSTGQRSQYFVHRIRHKRQCLRDEPDRALWERDDNYSFQHRSQRWIHRSTQYLWAAPFCNSIRGCAMHQHFSPDQWRDMVRTAIALFLLASSAFGQCGSMPLLGVGGACGGGGGGITPTTKTCANAGSGSSLSCTWSSNPQSGESVFCVVGNYTGSLTYSLTDNVSNSYTAYGAQLNAGQGYPQHFYYLGLPGAVHSMTASFSSAASFPFIACQTVTGTVAGTDVQVTNTGGGTITWSVTTNFSGDYLFCSDSSSGGGNSITAGAVLTLGSNGNAFGSGYAVVGAAGMYSPSMINSSGNGSAGICSSFKP